MLALGAAAAAFAALSKETHKPATVTTTVAQAHAARADHASADHAAARDAERHDAAAHRAVKPPKIPLTATPTPTTPSTSPRTTPTTPAATRTTPKPRHRAPPRRAPAPKNHNRPSILLDTNAASTYNPYNYPESDFGDPSLTIDGDTTTGWTAQVEPATAPKMAEGVLIDLKTAAEAGRAQADHRRRRA